MTHDMSNGAEKVREHPIETAQRGFDAWAAKEHNKKWFKRIDGTPIPNDLVVCIAMEFAALHSTSAAGETTSSDGVPGKQSASGAAAAPIETEDAEVAFSPSELLFYGLTDAVGLSVAIHSIGGGKIKHEFDRINIKQLIDALRPSEAIPADVCQRCQGGGFINTHANLPDVPCPSCSQDQAAESQREGQAQTGPVKAKTSPSALGAGDQPVLSAHVLAMKEALDAAAKYIEQICKYERDEATEDVLRDAYDAAIDKLSPEVKERNQ